MTDNDQLQMALSNEQYNNVISWQFLQRQIFWQYAIEKVRRILNLNLGFRYQKQKQDASNLHLRFHIVDLPRIQLTPPKNITKIAIISDDYHFIFFTSVLKS